MITIEETISPNGLVNYSLSEPYNTRKRFHLKSDHNAKMNLDSLVEIYDSKQYGQDDYDDDDYDDEDYDDEEEDDEESSLSDSSYYIRQAPSKTEQGLFLHFSDDGDSFLRRDSVIRLTIDGKNYKLPCYFASEGKRCGINYSTDLYYQINSKLLKELAAATSIRLSYEPEYEMSGCKAIKDLNIDGFKKYALFYYEGYYIEHHGTPEEKEKFRQELQAQKDAVKKRAEEEKVLKEQQQAALKAEWDNADPLSKVWIMLKRNWKLVLLILFIFWCWYVVRNDY